MSKIILETGFLSPPPYNRDQLRNKYLWFWYDNQDIAFHCNYYKRISGVIFCLKLLHCHQSSGRQKDISKILSSFYFCGQNCPENVDWKADTVW